MIWNMNMSITWMNMARGESSITSKCWIYSQGTPNSRLRLTADAEAVLFASAVECFEFHKSHESLPHVFHILENISFHVWSWKWRMERRGDAYQVGRVLEEEKSHEAIWSSGERIRFYDFYSISRCWLIKTTSWLLLTNSSFPTLRKILAQNLVKIQSYCFQVSTNTNLLKC